MNEFDILKKQEFKLILSSNMSAEIPFYRPDKPEIVAAKAPLNVQLRRRIQQVPRAIMESRSRIVDAEELGNHHSVGERYEMRIASFFASELFQPWVKDVKICGAIPAKDKDGIDVELEIDCDSSTGLTLVQIVQHDKFAIQVKPNNRKVQHFIKTKTKREVHRQDWLGKGRMVFDASQSPEFLMADLGLQMMILSGNLFDQEAVKRYVSAFEGSVEDAMTNPTILEEVVPQRTLLIEKFYPQAGRNSMVTSQHVVQTFSEINWM